MPRFTTTLFRIAGKGGWTFAPVPEEHAPEVAGPWGMTPVRACLAGRSWATSVWRDRTHGTLLPVPAKIRGELAEGDVVEVEVEADPDRPRSQASPRRERR